MYCNSLHRMHTKSTQTSTVKSTLTSTSSGKDKASKFKSPACSANVAPLHGKRGVQESLSRGALYLCAAVGHAMWE